VSGLAELRQTIADAIKGVGDPPLTGYAYPPADVVTPCGIVDPDEVDWASAPATFRRGTEEWTLSVFVLIAPADAEMATKQTDRFFDQSGNDLKNAIEEADERLAVTGADRWGEYPYPPGSGVTYQGFRLIVKANNDTED
jgi:hypothetical protein